uniref:Uncharacterized protein n=1 Tax=Romanomermis culicivorax TaxID=13658 RepID=A0A915J0W2_ROMCU
MQLDMEQYLKYNVTRINSRVPQESNEDYCKSIDSRITVQRCKYDVNVNVMKMQSSYDGYTKSHILTESYKLFCIHNTHNDTTTKSTTTICILARKKKLRRGGWYIKRMADCTGWPTVPAGRLKHMVECAVWPKAYYYFSIHGFSCVKSAWAFAFVENQCKNILYMIRFINYFKLNSATCYTRLSSTVGHVLQLATRYSRPAGAVGQPVQLTRRHSRSPGLLRNSSIILNHACVHKSITILKRVLRRDAHNPTNTMCTMPVESSSSAEPFVL